jgi:DNA replication protein DnaC
MNDEARKERMRDGIGCALCDYQGFTIGENGKSYFCACSRRKAMIKLCEEAQIPRSYWNKTLDDWNIHQDANGYDLGSQKKLSEKIRVLFAFYSKHFTNIANGHPPTVKRSGVKERLHSLVLEGGNGSGKTFLIAVVMQAAMHKGNTAYFIEWSDLIDICN